MFARMLQQFCTIDILVNNAGLQRDSTFHEMTLADWNKGLERQPHGAVPVRARSHPGILAARRGAFYFERRRQDHLHEFGSPGDSLGRPRQLRYVQGRHPPIDGEHGTGGRSEADSRQWFEDQIRERLPKTKIIQPMPGITVDAL